jgi:AbrB family looped-hinge helix DNA binding protein
MTLRVDNAGRIAIPKPMLDQWGLSEGSELEVIDSPSGVLLKPAGREPVLVYEDGMLVHTGRLPEGLDWFKLVDEDREERMREIAGH